MNPVKVYDSSGSLKKIISSKELKKRADMLINKPYAIQKNKQETLYTSIRLSLQESSGLSV